MPDDAVPPADVPTQPPPAYDQPPIDPRPPGSGEPPTRPASEPPTQPTAEPPTQPRPPEYDAPPTVPPWPPASPGPAPSGPSPAEPQRRSRLRQFVVGAVVGGLCGAVVASGAFVAFDRNDTTATAPKPAEGTTEIARESSSIGRNGDIAGIIAKVEPAVFAVTVDSRRTPERRDRVRHLADGYVVTNAHVVEDAQQVEAEFNDGTDARRGDRRPRPERRRRGPQVERYRTAGGVPRRLQRGPGRRRRRRDRQRARTRRRFQRHRGDHLGTAATGAEIGTALETSSRPTPPSTPATPAARCRRPRRRDRDQHRRSQDAAAERRVRHPDVARQDRRRRHRSRSQACVPRCRRPRT